MRTVYLFAVTAVLAGGLSAGNCGGCAEPCGEKEAAGAVHSDNGGCGSGEVILKNASAGSMKQGETFAYYTCPVEGCSEKHESKDGTCESCGKELVRTVITAPASAEFYGCPMEAHSSYRSDAPGSCPECGMSLKPMRLIR